MKKLISFTLLMVLTHFPFFIFLSGCGCGPFDDEEIKIAEMSIQVGCYFSEFNIACSSMDSGEPAIRLNIRDISFKIISQNNFNFSFINQAYACSPPEPQFNQKIVSIEITPSQESIFSGNKEFRIGENIKELFNISNKENKSVDEYIEYQNRNIRDFVYPDDHLVFQLRNQPDIQIKQKLQLRIVFDDGTEFTLVTEEFSC